MWLMRHRHLVEQEPKLAIYDVLEAINWARAQYFYKASGYFWKSQNKVNSLLIHMRDLTLFWYFV